MEDSLSVIGQFLNYKDTFRVSCVSKEWYRSQNPNKRIIIRKIQKEMWKCHILNNCCPCLLEEFGAHIIPNFRLKRYLCASINEFEEAPQWIYKYL